jgi:hypothetical protein
MAAIVRLFPLAINGLRGGKRALDGLVKAGDSICKYK